MTNWLGNAVVYEIYPQSFMDTNGDGVVYDETDPETDAGMPGSSEEEE